MTITRRREDSLRLVNRILEKIEAMKKHIEDNNEQEFYAEANHLEVILSIWLDRN